jgi:hypothetical protein
LEEIILGSEECAVAVVPHHDGALVIFWHDHHIFGKRAHFTPCVIDHDGVVRTKAILWDAIAYKLFPYLWKISHRVPIVFACRILFVVPSIK